MAKLRGPDQRQVSFNDDGVRVITEEVARALKAAEGEPRARHVPLEPRGGHLGRAACRCEAKEAMRGGEEIRKRVRKGAGEKWSQRAVQRCGHSEWRGREAQMRTEGDDAAVGPLEAAGPNLRAACGGELHHALLSEQHQPAVGSTAVRRVSRCALCAQTCGSVRERAGRRQT